MSNPATVISLRARPAQVAHLCFPVDGIIGELGQRELPRQKRWRPIQLGDSVTKFDFSTFYGNLNAYGGDQSLLSFDSRGILYDSSVQASLIMTQRAESPKAVLDKAIKARQNAYYAKYANQDQIIGIMQQFYNMQRPAATITKPDMLEKLRLTAQAQDNNLQAAYFANLKAGVVEHTTSELQSQTEGNVYVQTITNTDYGYRMPSYESTAQNLRAQISLMDQQFQQFMFAQSLPYLDQIFQNEKQTMDLDVKRLQVAYLNTILMSPIDGVITGIYKNPGDWVQAGEPAVRVENNSTIYLVGTLKCQALISIGSQVTVTTQLFDSAAPMSLPGSVVSVRGHRNEDDQWDVHVLCDNFNLADPSLTPILPLNYHFDYDNTSVTIN